MNNFNILGENNFSNPYPSILSAVDFSTNLYPSINTAIANGGYGIFHRFRANHTELPSRGNLEWSNLYLKIS